MNDTLWQVCVYMLFYIQFSHHKSLNTCEFQMLFTDCIVCVLSCEMVRGVFLTYVSSWVCLQRSYGVINIPAVTAAPLTLRYMTRQLCLYLSTCCTFSPNVSLNFFTPEHPPTQTNTYKHIPTTITKKPKAKYLFLLHVGVSSDSYHAYAVI